MRPHEAQGQQEAQERRDVPLPVSFRPRKRALGPARGSQRPVRRLLGRLRAFVLRALVALGLTGGRSGGHLDLGAGAGHHLRLFSWSHLGVKARPAGRRIACRSPP